MFNFEYFDPNLGPISVSIAEYGLTFSKGTVDIMNRPKYVKLGFDKEHLVVGVVPTTEDDERAIPFIEKEKNGYVRINNKEFIRYLIRFFPDDWEQRFSNKSIRYLTYWDDENSILVVDLKKTLDKNIDINSDDNANQGNVI